jgi:hypothetical protein
MIGSIFEGPRRGPVTVSTGSKGDFLVLEARVDALELACTAMWTLLKSRSGFTDEELAVAIRDVDLRDGKLDGKKASEPAVCQRCGRPMLTRSRTRCLWCGAKLLEATL